MAQVEQRPKVALVDLDGQTVPAWVVEKLAHEGLDFAFFDCKTRDDLAKYAGAAEIVWLFGGSRILQGNMALVPRCRGILRTGSGTDNVPVDEATRRKIVVANTPAAFSDGASDQAISLLFAVVRQIALADRVVRAGRWGQVPVQPLNSVNGRTLGLVGFGHIAREVARKLRGFDMRILVHDPFLAAEAMAGHGVKSVGLSELLAEADFVSLHCPLSEKTRRLIGDQQLRQMKPTAILINTSRGPVVDEQALVRALQERRIAAAGLDVFEDEPPKADNPLLKLDNVVLTPHIAGMSVTGVETRWRLSVETVLALARHQAPPSWVNREISGVQ